MCGAVHREGLGQDGRCPTSCPTALGPASGPFAPVLLSETEMVPLAELLKGTGVEGCPSGGGDKLGGAFPALGTSGFPSSPLPAVSWRC